MPKASRTSSRRTRVTVEEPAEGAPSASRRAHRARSAGRVVVTGASGRIGRLVVAGLRAHNRQVIAVSRHPAATPSPPGTVHVTADVANPGWERWCEGSGALVHLVGTPWPEGGAAGLDRVHRVATKTAVEACERLGIERLVVLSAAAVRPDAPTAYLRSRWEGEEVVRGSDLAWTIVRPSWVFGATDPVSRALAAHVRRFPLVPVPGDGTAEFDPVADIDVADTLIACLRFRSKRGHVIELPGPERLTLDELIRRTARALGLRRGLVHVPERLARFALPFMKHLRPTITTDELTLALSGLTSGPPPDDVKIAAPTRRFEGPVPG